MPRLASEDTKGTDEWFGLAAPFNRSKGFYKSNRRKRSIAQKLIMVAELISAPRRRRLHLFLASFQVHHRKDCVV